MSCILQRLVKGMLVACAVGTAAAAGAADSAPKRHPPRPHELRMLERQLGALQAQVHELMEQNRQLERREQELEQRLAQPSAPQAAAQAGAGQTHRTAPGAAAPVQSAQAAAPGAGTTASSALPPFSALPSSSSALPAANSPAVPFTLQNWHPWGYGEIYYSHPVREPRHTQADLARAVIGIGYTFDPRTEFNSEFEIEHAVTSASDAGEFEVEQFYVDRQLSEEAYLRAGLFLMPFGLLNEHHEPVYYYGVQRNFIETLIIPSTWREGGVGLHGNTLSGFGWNVGVTTSVDLSKWAFTSEFPAYVTPLDLANNGVAPLQATHQELALANAQHPFEYASLTYDGLPGLAVGGAIGTGDAAKVTASANASFPGSERVTLWEGHARWTPGNFDLAALYAHGQIGNIALANATNPGSPNPIPSDFYGYYLQAAYQAWQRGDYRLSPFVRWELYNMGSRYEGTSGPVIPSGLTPLSAAPGDYGYWPRVEDRVTTAGANFYVTSHVVVKGDYQWFRVNRDFDRFDLGLGISY